jgi:5-methylcytosine-specific restriction endonuclease McrA
MTGEAMQKTYRMVTKKQRIKRAQKEGRAGEVIGRREMLRRKWLLRQLINKFQGECATCGIQVTVKDPEDPTYATVRHVVPLSEGGDDKIKNMALACRGCNARRGIHTNR